MKKKKKKNPGSYSKFERNVKYIPVKGREKVLERRKQLKLHKDLVFDPSERISGDVKVLQK